MSNFLQQLQRTFEAKPFVSNYERLAWLNQRVFTVAELTGADDWARLLTRLAKHRARAAEVAVAEAWFQVAHALAAAVPDPDDVLLGIDAAVYAQSVGIEYDDVERYLLLIGGYRTLFEAWGETDDPDPDITDHYPFHAFLTCRLMDIETALENPLEDGTRLTDTHLADPDVVVAASRLLWEAVEDHGEDHEENGVPMGDDEVEAFIAYGGHFLWACFHAHRTGVGHDELKPFVCLYLTEWFDLLSQLVRRDLLEPGVLTALVTTDAPYERVVRDGVETVAAFRKLAPANTTLTEYLDMALTAVTTDA